MFSANIFSVFVRHPSLCLGFCVIYVFQCCAYMHDSNIFSIEGSSQSLFSPFKSNNQVINLISRPGIVYLWESYRIMVNLESACKLCMSVRLVSVLCLFHEVSAFSDYENTIFFVLSLCVAFSVSVKLLYSMSVTVIFLKIYCSRIRLCFLFFLRLSQIVKWTSKFCCVSKEKGEVLNCCKVHCSAQLSYNLKVALTWLQRL